MTLKYLYSLMNYFIYTLLFNNQIINQVLDIKYINFVINQ